MIEERWGSGKCSHVLYYWLLTKQGGRKRDEIWQPEIDKGSSWSYFLYHLHTTPGDIFHWHNMRSHLHADDTQLYLTFDGTNDDLKQSALAQIEICFAEMKDWMLINKLKLNGNKTEFLQFYPLKWNTVETSLPVINIGDDTVKPSDMA